MPTQHVGALHPLRTRQDPVYAPLAPHHKMTSIIAKGSCHSLAQCLSCPGETIPERCLLASGLERPSLAPLRDPQRRAAAPHSCHARAEIAPFAVLLRGRGPPRQQRGNKPQVLSPATLACGAWCKHARSLCISLCLPLCLGLSSLRGMRQWMAPFWHLSSVHSLGTVCPWAPPRVPLPVPRGAQIPHSSRPLHTNTFTCQLCWE